MSEVLPAGRPAPGRARGVRGWARLRGRHLGGVAFVASRLTGLMIIGYLYLHLAVLFLLTRGPRSWHSVLTLFRNPYFRGLEAVLILLILVHALNGLRLVLVGSGIGVRHQKAMFLTALSASAVLIAGAAVAMFGVV